ncbi:hypothetical protein [Streptomyces sp. NPDC047315]|uniref:hypothetical protein n=1 Tax=Streptomyces sp. NPDC047315 TaxID=3155142 RepID=UPI0033F590B1
MTAAGVGKSKYHKRGWVNGPYVTLDVYPLPPRFRTQARALAADLVEARPRWLDTSEAGWKLLNALRAYAADSTST